MTSNDRICSVGGCGRRVRCRGWCNTHYRRWLAHGDPLHCRKMSNGGVCSVDLCHGPVVGRGWCRKHYSRWHKTGSLRRVMPVRDGVCTVDQCGKKHTAQGLCAMHYSRRMLSQRVQVCSIDGCDRLVQSRGWCRTHYTRWRKHGSPVATCWDRSLDNVPAMLYRLWGANGELLYIGITIDVARRFTEHGKFSSWWPDVRFCGVNAFETRARAMAAEREAIRSESPRHNVKHIRAA